MSSVTPAQHSFAGSSCRRLRLLSIASQARHVGGALYRLLHNLPSSRPLSRHLQSADSSVTPAQHSFAGSGCRGSSASRSLFSPSGARGASPPPSSSPAPRVHFSLTSSSFRSMLETETRSKNCGGAPQTPLHFWGESPQTPLQYSSVAHVNFPSH